MSMGPWIGLGVATFTGVQMIYGLHVESMETDQKELKESLDAFDLGKIKDLEQANGNRDRVKNINNFYEDDDCPLKIRFKGQSLSLSKAKETERLLDERIVAHKPYSLLHRIRDRCKVQE
jgi:hypothetical protein